MDMGTRAWGKKHTCMEGRGSYALAFMKRCIVGVTSYLGASRESNSIMAILNIFFVLRAIL